MSLPPELKCRASWLRLLPTLLHWADKAASAALRHHNGVLDVHTVQDTADEFGLDEVEFFAGVCDPQLFFCGHSEFDDVCFSRRVVAVLSCVSVRTFHFNHIRSPVKIENALIPDGEGYVMRHAAFAPTVRSWSRVWGRATVAKQ